MYGTWKIIALTPFGRRRYVSMLHRYVEQARPLVDEYQLWLNTEDPLDEQWGQRLIASDPEFYRPISCDAPQTGNRFGRFPGFYPLYSPQPDTIYIRLDDDIVWVAPDAIEQLVRFRVENPDFFLIYANTVNNSICTHLHQRMGLLPASPFIGYGFWSERSEDWETAAVAHQSLLDAVENETWSRFLFERWVLNEGEYCRINCICWWGEHWDVINSVLTDQEELAMSCDVPRRLGKHNCIAGKALVSHFAYDRQRQPLEEQRPDLLARYAALVENVSMQEIDHS